MKKLVGGGYLNRIQSSRRLEREAQRNVELMWLTGRLAPDFKTIANFRKDNGKAIGKVCRQFVVLCQQLDLFSDAVIAIDGSKFKAVNSSDRNFTDAKLKRRMAEIEANIGRYLAELDTADRQEPASAKSKSARLNDKIAAMKSQMATLKEIEAKLIETGETQISLTDPDSRSMMTRGSGIVGYNVQTAVDAKHHLIVEHEVTNNGSDRDQLSGMARKARAAIGTTTLTAIADRGYFKGEEILACHEAGIGTLATDEDLRSQSRWPVRQGRLHLRPAKERVSLPGRRIPDLALLECRERHDEPPLLELELQGLRSQGQMHAELAAASDPLGTSGRARRNAGASGTDAGRHANQALDGRASIRDDQSMDGIDTLPDERTGARQGRDEPARARL